MQLFQQPFDAKTVKPNEAFEPLPAGWYNARIINSEAKPTKDNESGYLLMELEIIDGDHKGRKVFDRLNLWNKSTQATEIAHRQLSAYCHATGVFILQDSVQLHGIPLKIKLSVRTQDGYDPSNDVKAVKHIQDNVPTAQPAPFAAPAQPSMPAAPFGQNPALPPMPGPSGFAPQQAPVAAPAMQQQPAQSPPWAQPAMPAQQPQQFAPMPTVPTQPQQQQWAPPAQQPMPPTAGPVPPWRK